jgi:methylated-DNA-[protein]-cysteine S-methyltransferase
MTMQTETRSGVSLQAATPVYYRFLASPIGELMLTGDGAALTGIWFPDDRQTTTPQPSWRRDDEVFGEVSRQLSAYFGGELTEFQLTLQPHGTPFQQLVWDALRKIPYGVTTSYGKLAADLGDPRATRAVGLANGRNPIPIIIPCHRVIGADGSLTGYGGGMHRKHWLLALEGRALPFL